MFRNAEWDTCLREADCLHCVLIAYFNSRVSQKPWVNIRREVVSICKAVYGKLALVALISGGLDDIANDRSVWEHELS